MTASTYKLHRRALTALNELDAEERTQVMDRLASLLDLPSNEWPKGVAKKLAGDEQLYLIRINDSLRAIVRVIEGQQPELLDLVRHETLELFAQNGVSTNP